MYIFSAINTKSIYYKFCFTNITRFIFNTRYAISGVYVYTVYILNFIDFFLILFVSFILAASPKGINENKLLLTFD